MAALSAAGGPGAAGCVGGAPALTGAGGVTGGTRSTTTLFGTDDGVGNVSLLCLLYWCSHSLDFQFL